MTTNNILLYLHGHGSDAAEASARLARIDPDRQYRHVTIDAPIDLGEGRGRSWFDTGPTGIDADALRVASGHVLHVLHALLAEDPDAHVVLGGFSQGAAVAVAAASAHTSGIAAIVLHCGFFPDPIEDLSAVAGLPVLACSAIDDDVVPDFFTDALVDQLRSAAAEVEHSVLPGGHAFSDEMAARTADFLDAHLESR